MRVSAFARRDRGGYDPGKSRPLPVAIRDELPQPGGHLNLV